MIIGVSITKLINISILTILIIIGNCFFIFVFLLVDVVIYKILGLTVLFYQVRIDGELSYCLFKDLVVVILIFYKDGSFCVSYPTVLVIDNDSSIFQHFGFHDISTGCAFVLHIFKVECETRLANAVATEHFPRQSL